MRDQAASNTGQESNDLGRDNGRLHRIHHSLREDIDTRSHLLEGQLLTLSLAIGIQDAISIPDFQCFASNQTGNTVLLAVGLLQSTSGSSTSRPASTFSLLTIFVSLSIFILGVVSSGQIANGLRVTNRRWWLVISSSVQTVLVFVAAVLQFRYMEAQTGDAILGRVTLGLLAFSSGMQVAMVRAMKISDITTAMATSAYVDILIDPQLIGAFRANRGRNRRVAFLFSLVAGSFIGAAIAREFGSAVAVFVSGGLKTVVTVSFFGNCAEQVRCVDSARAEESKGGDAPRCGV